MKFQFFFSLQQAPYRNHPDPWSKFHSAQMYRCNEIAALSGRRS